MSKDLYDIFKKEAFESVASKEKNAICEKFKSLNGGEERLIYNDCATIRSISTLLQSLGIDVPQILSFSQLFVVIDDLLLRT